MDVLGQDIDMPGGLQMSVTDTASNKLCDISCSLSAETTQQ